MDSVPSRRRARLVLLPDLDPPVASEPTPGSEPAGDGDEDPPSPETGARFWVQGSISPVDLRQAIGTGDDSLKNPAAGKDRHPEGAPGLSEELGQGLGWIGGVAIALLTLIVPLTSVVMDREHRPAGALLPRLTDTGQRDGSLHPPGVSSTGIGQSVGGDSGRKP